MSKKIKAFELDALRQAVGGVKDCVLLEPLKVDALTEYEFRKKLREKKVKVQLVKNTFARKIFAESGVTLDGVWSGPTLLCWGASNIKELSNAVDDQIKASKKDPKSPEKFKVKTAVADGQPVTMEVAKTLPTREEAIGEILSAVTGVGSSLVAAIIAPGADLAGILKAIEEKKPEGEPAPGGEPTAA